MRGITHMKSGIKATVGSLVVIALVAAAFLGGALYGEMGGVVPSVGTLVGAKSDLATVVDQVDRIIAREALVPSPESSITANAVQGMLNSLEDTYAVYYDPAQFSELKQDQKGEFFGIGVSIGLNKAGQPYASRVFEKTPASRAGIKTGDVFTAVGSVRKAKWDLEQFVGLVRGPIGTKVTLEVTRAGKPPFSVTLTRDRIAVPNTMTKMYGEVGYVRLMTFNELSSADVAKAIKDFDAKGAKGYILDLRENPGGLLRSAVDVVSLFVEEGVVVRVDQRGKKEELDFASGHRITGKPLVVLVDGGSASASEIVTGALKDYSRAVIVGETTYGKGSVQSIEPLGNGGAVKLTIAHYLTPLKHVINGIGVTPDVVVKMDPKLQLDAKTDTQLTRALAVLRAKL
jgi:carboxyl-terminal processing protease